MSDGIDSYRRRNVKQIGHGQIQSKLQPGESHNVAGVGSGTKQRKFREPDWNRSSTSKTKSSKRKNKSPLKNNGGTGAGAGEGSTW